MKRNLIILAVAVLALSACKQFKKGDGDMQYKLVEDKDGATIKEGDFVAFKLIEKTEEDSIVFNSYDVDRPAYLIQNKAAFKGDIYTALGLMSEGDSGIFKINLDSLQLKMGMPKPQNTKGKYMLFTFKIEKVIAKGNMTDSALQATAQKYMDEDLAKAKSGEAAKVANYISKNNLKPLATSSGLKYVILTEGKGPKAEVGDTVAANYTGKFLSGKVFDTSYPDVAKKEGLFNPMRPYEPMKVSLGTASIIPGLDEALLLLPKGTKATVIIPSELAYGQQGSQMIPPYTPLVFEVEVVNITPKKPGSVTPPPPVAPQQ